MANECWICKDGGIWLESEMLKARVSEGTPNNDLNAKMRPITMAESKRKQKKKNLEETKTIHKKP